VFYAPAIGYYVVTRYSDIKAIFLDPETYSAAVTQLPLVQIVPEAAQILMGSGYRPQPSMVSLDPPSHTPTFTDSACFYARASHEDGIKNPVHHRPTPRCD
jgi:hypothetical protein